MHANCMSKNKVNAYIVLLYLYKYEIYKYDTISQNERIMNIIIFTKEFS